MKNNFLGGVSTDLMVNLDLAEVSGTLFKALFGGKRLLLFVTFLFSAQFAFAQQADSLSAVAQVPADSTSSRNFHILPAFSYAPETSLGLGISAIQLYKPEKNVRASNITLTALYTLRKQIMIEGLTTTFLKGEQWLIKGKVNYKKFPEFFYGIGENTNKSDKGKVSYEYYNFSAAVMHKVRGKLFAGLQGQFNRYYNVKNESGKVIASDTIAGSYGARNAGLGVILLYDTRDNVLNATRGMYAEVSGMLYRKALGGQINYTAMTIDLRRYFRIGPKQVIACQLLSLTKQGAIPFLQLSYLGGSDIMRGFYSGRYRDKDLLAVQAEYRRELNRKWGVVLFAGLGNVTDEWKNFRTDHLKNSLGFGFRRTIDKKERVNLRFDLGFGNGQPNFYVNIAEAF